MPTLVAGVEPLAVVFGLLGFAWGVAADRVAARWPAHEDGSVRRVDWRTAVVAVFGAAALSVVAAVAASMVGGKNPAAILSAVAVAVGTTGVVAGLWRAKRMLRAGCAKR